jgi:ubiquinone/menaquinone biosynthesis C-methylase UbiE
LKDQDYEYRDLLAQTWDLLRGDTSQWPDKFFYLDFIHQYGGPVLDVGCGTGRLLLDYMMTGIDIDGVDNSPEMLILCRKKASDIGLNPTLFQQSIEELSLPRKYRIILVPSSSFQLVTDSILARGAIKRLYQHLESGGILIMPFMILWQNEDALQTDWNLVAEKERPEDGAVVRRWLRARYEVKNQLEHTEDRFEISLNGEIIASEEHARSPATRWYSQSQAIYLYQGAGFTELQVLSEFSQQPASDEDTIFSIVGTRPTHEAVGLD